MFINNSAITYKRVHKKTKLISLPTNRVKHKRSHTHLYCITIAVLVSANLYLQTSISDINKEISKANLAIKSLKSTETMYNIKLENLYSYKVLWDKAEKLGMKPRSESQVHYIDTSTDDYAEIISEKKVELDKNN